MQCIGLGAQRAVLHCLITVHFCCSDVNSDLQMTTTMGMVCTTTMTTSVATMVISMATTTALVDLQLLQQLVVVQLLQQLLAKSRGCFTCLQFPMMQRC